jgi:hypothetical protein
MNDKHSNKETSMQPSPTTSRSRFRIAGATMLLAACLPAFGAAGTAQEATYHLEKQVTIPGADTGWDYSAYDPASGRMFIAHRKDGLHVYDTRKGAVIATLADSRGANTAALAPEFDLGIAGTTDGQVVLFRISTLATLSRYQSGTGGFDGAAYDPVSKRFVMVGEADDDKGTTPVLFFDAASGKQAGALTVASIKVDAPRVDERGGVLFPLRDKHQVLKLDMRAMKFEASFALSGCRHPAALELDNRSRRVFVGCRGDAGSAPALAVLDAASGAQLATLPIGRGVDEVMYDPRARSSVTANGNDASMTVIRQASPDSYALDATVGTFPMARTGVLDPLTGKVYLVRAQYSIRYQDGKAQETRFTPNTFSVLTYAR